MAIVKDYIHPNGARVIIHEDCYRDISEEELERRRAEVRRVMAMIYTMNRKDEENEITGT